MARVIIALREDGCGKVEVNGVDISDVVKQVTFNAVAGEGLEMVIRLLPIAIEAELEVEDEVDYTT